MLKEITRAGLMTWSTEVIDSAVDAGNEKIIVYAMRHSCPISNKARNYLSHRLSNRRSAAYYSSRTNHDDIFPPLLFDDLREQTHVFYPHL